MYLANVADRFVISLRDGQLQIAPHALQAVGKGQRIDVIVVRNDLETARGGTYARGRSD